jgi:hypothetical protein
MAIFTKVLLSGSTGGMPIKITNTASPGTLIHTTELNSSIIDEIWLYATNTSSVQATLTIEYGGSTDPDNFIDIAIPAQSGLSIILPGLVLSGNNTVGRSINAHSATANVINVVGYINRIS